MKMRPYSEKIILSKEDDEAAIMAIFTDIKATKPKMTFSLMNIYREKCCQGRLRPRPGRSEADIPCMAVAVTEQ
jgi:hypothetical protein